MAYRVILAGIPVECDSMEEAIALAEKAAATSGKAITPVAGVPAVTDSRWTEARMTDLFRRLKANQRKLVDELLDHPEGRTDKQLLDALKLKDGKALAGVFTAVWKNAKKVGADPSDVYRRQAVTIADQKANEYTLTESFRRIAKEVRAKVKK